jgi:hypothetical protein
VYDEEQKMLTRAKLFGLTIVALLVLTLVPGTPTTAALASASDRTKVTAALQGACATSIKNTGLVTDRATTATMPALFPAAFAQQSDGGLIAYIGLDGNVWLISSDGGTPVQLTEDATFTNDLSR